MLTHADRQSFEQIRARWEAAQSGQKGTVNMVGRKSSQVPLNGEDLENGGSKFRRKLSYGLAFISNPLSQRKITPGRHNTSDISLTVTASTTISNTGHLLETPLSPTRISSSSERSNGATAKPTTPVTQGSPTGSLESEATPKALSRSQTVSFIPRPARSDSDTSVAEFESTIKIRSMPRTMPSKIPTPSPPLSDRRVPSPRQYLPHRTSLYAKHVPTGDAYTRNSTGSPVRAVMKSRTTPNLVKAAYSPRPASFMAPGTAGSKRSAASPTIQKPNLQENIPTTKRMTQRHSQIHEKSLRRESLTAPTTLANRRSFGPGSPLEMERFSNRNTPLTARKRLSSNLAQQSPVTVRRVQANEQMIVHTADRTHERNSRSIAQPRLMGPLNPPTPTPSVSQPETPKSALPRSNTDKDFQRKILETPNGLGGVWRSSRALAGANHEVSKLPRSNTFHDFGISWNAAPPVPPVPEQYRTPSLSSFFQISFETSKTPGRARHTRMVSDAASCESIPEESWEILDSDQSIVSSQTGLTQPSASRSQEFEDYTALPELALRPRPTTSIPATDSESSLADGYFERPWPISNSRLGDNADAEPHLQVKDYMPPLYWAGRFQARLDQWHTRAMDAELQLNQHTLSESSLDQCKLTENKMAACYIFAQLRDLCVTDQAADSLWVGLSGLGSCALRKC
jgi:hypothetical protein